MPVPNSGNFWQCQTHLSAVLLEELGGVHSVCDSASNEGEPVEDHRGLVGVLGEQLVENIENDGESNECSQANSNLLAQGKLLVLLRERVAREVVEETHGWVL